jgi:hypothetical protein
MNVAHAACMQNVSKVWQDIYAANVATALTSKAEPSVQSLLNTYSYGESS